MTGWLIFASEGAVALAESRISDAMSLPVAGGVTSRWATPRPTAGGAWAIRQPEDRFMDGVEDYAIATEVEWPAEPGTGG